MLFITFYTPDYAHPVEILRRSCEKVGVNLKAVPVPTRGRTWREMVRFKPLFIHRMMIEHKNSERIIVWIDADSRVRKYPAAFETLDADIAARLWSGKTSIESKSDWTDRASLVDSEVMTGVMVLRNSRLVRGTILRWAQLVSEMSVETKRPDQQAMSRALLESAVSFRALPMEYCFWRRFWPHTSSREAFDATIQVSRWVCKDPVQAERMAREEYSRRLNGTWKAEDWEWER